MNRKIISLFLVTISLLLCTGCFDLEEKIIFRKDGSGNFTFKVDMSQLKMFFGSENSSTTAGSEPADKLDNKLDEFNSKLEKIDGISNVKQHIDTTNIIVSISFDFNKITALNNGMHLIFNDEDDTHQPSKKTNSDHPTTNYFEWKGNQIVRIAEKKGADFLKAGILDKNATAEQNSITQQLLNTDDIFKTVSYTSIYTFETPIKESSNKKAALSNHKKMITLKCYPFTKDSTHQCSLANTITIQ